MSRPPLPLEAALLRAALLTGLAHERDVAAWATDRLAGEHDFDAELTEVVLAPEELTAQREALRPLAARGDAEEVAAALRGWALADVREGQRPLGGALRLLSDLRREGFLTAHGADSVKELEDRANMAGVGMKGVVAPTLEELEEVLVAEVGRGELPALVPELLGARRASRPN